MITDDAEIVNSCVRPKDFQYKFVQVLTRGSSQVVTGVVPTTKSLIIKSANGAQKIE